MIAVDSCDDGNGDGNGDGNDDWLLYNFERTGNHQWRIGEGENPCPWLWHSHVESTQKVLYQLGAGKSGLCF
jgi:hypothetical protein